MKDLLIGAAITFTIGCSPRVSQEQVTETLSKAPDQTVTVDSAADPPVRENPGQMNPDEPSTGEEAANEIANAEELDDDAMTLMRMMLEQEHGETISSEPSERK